MTTEMDAFADSMNDSINREVTAMEIKDFASRLVARNEALETVEAKIRPLPQNVVPSEEFLARMRLRLLKLTPEAHAPRRAA